MPYLNDGYFAFSGCKYCEHGSCHDTEVRKVENDFPQRAPFYPEAEVIYHIAPFQSVVGITVCSAELKGKPQMQGMASSLSQSEQKDNT